jgi:dTMP kinase
LRLPTRPPGALITFEGLDGCGKTTQLELEAQRLLREGWVVTATKEPGGTPVGRKIREMVLNTVNGPLCATTELALMLAARAQHIHEVIRPALESGVLVLCDRFTDSTIAYQGYGRGVPLDQLETLDRILCHSLRPQLTLLIDIDPETAAERTGSRNRAAQQNETRFEDEGLVFFRRVQQGYHAIAQREPDRVRLLNGRGSIAEVHERIRSVVQEFLMARSAQKK